ncbi:MAG: TetR/AcrR family transcriptional regulator, partial [Bacillota bacterium]|nr:TetR/AcrR family transcriptional regulator [Bacillota bacterium]
NQPSGCLVVNTAAMLNSLEPDLQTLIQRYLTQEKVLLQALLIAGQDELEPSVAIDALAASLQNAFIGIRVMAKVNPDSTTLTAIVQQTLKTLPWKEVF